MSGEPARMNNEKSDAIRRFKNMQNLKIELWKEFSNSRIGIAHGPTIDHNAFTLLKQLDIYSGKLNDKFLRCLARIQTLEELALDSVDVNVSKHGWTYLAKVIGLKKLKFGDIEDDIETE